MARLAPFDRTLELTPNQRILETWRTSEFLEEAPDSHLEVLLEKFDGVTKGTLIHTDMPENQVDSYRQGWEDFYFKPMKKHLK